MRIGEFEIPEPVPALQRPRLLAALQPWVDVGSVGTLTLSFLEQAFGGQELGRLHNPGRFFDFTRYRPIVRLEGQRRKITLPNTVLHYASHQGSDWLFLHALEPHANGEEYVESMLELMTRFGVSQYLIIGSMYAPVPHSRPLIPVGGSGSPDLRQELERLGVRTSNYEGPTSIVSLAGQLAEERGVESAIILVQLPAYAQLEQDIRGQHAALSLLRSLYGLDYNLDSLQLQAERQYQALDETARQDARVRQWLEELETVYDSELSEQKSDEPVQLSPEMEQFLKEIELKWDRSDD